MKTTLSWINDYVDIKDVSVKEFVDKMTYTGSKVERVTNLGEEIQGVVVGKIIELEKHPDADKLQVSKVDIGKEIIQVVTGAQNVKVGDYIPVATVGIGNAKNAGYLAVQILAIKYPELREKLVAFRAKLASDAAASGLDVEL